MINLAVMLALAMHVKESKYANNAHFNTASGKPIGVDNRCSGWISNIMDDFIDPLVECDNAIKGLGLTRTGGIKI